MRKLQWHVLRHSFASHLVLKGIPLKAVQDLLGHATYEMTLRYAHLAPSVHRAAVEVLDEEVDDESPITSLRGKTEKFGHILGTSRGPKIESAGDV